MDYTNQKEKIKRELEKAKINTNGIIGVVGDWTLKRGSTYWIAETNEGIPLYAAQILYDKEYPNELFEDCEITKMGSVIRMEGHAGAPNPSKYYKHIENSVNKDGKKIDLSDKKIGCYHIDTQLGLNVFVKFISEELPSIINNDEKISKFKNYWNSLILEDNEY